MSLIFDENQLTDDKFLCGRLRLLQPEKGYRAATDAVLLAAACPAVAGQSVLDLGCGAGAASLCLAARVPGLRLTGLEVQPEYADLARRNAARNGIAMEVA
jgi:tRNA1Val (adenine37-N6)-methyltransferase